MDSSPETSPSKTLDKSHVEPVIRVKPRRNFRTLLFLHGLVSGSILILVLGLATLLNSYAETLSAQWAEGLRNAKEKPIENFAPGQKSPSDPKQMRVQEQLQEIRTRANTHFKIMTYFYARYYTATTLGTLCNILTGVCLFFISYTGWKRSNPYVINSFILLSGSAVFLGAMPPTLKLEQNIADNKALYLKYVALENEILSYQITGQNINKEKADAATFIHYLDRELATNNQLAIGFDATSIPKYQDLYKDLPKGQ